MDNKAWELLSTYSQIQQTLEYNINERLSKIRLKRKFRTITIISTLTLMEEKFYEELDNIPAHVRGYDMVRVIGKECQKQQGHI